MPLPLTHKCIADHRSETIEHGRFRRTVISAVVPMIAGAIIAGLLPLSAEAQTSPQPLTPQAARRIRMPFRWPVVGQVVPNNPAAAVRGTKHVIKAGKAPVLEADAERELLGSIPSTTLHDLRDRALIATLTYPFTRITAALKAKVEDLRPRVAA